METLFNVQDKVIVITGGLGLLGRTWVKGLLDRGGKVVVFDTKTDEATMGTIFPSGAPPELLVLQVDVRERASIERACEIVKEKWGVPHGLVNAAAIDAPPNAPVSENGPFEDYPQSSWDTVMDVNVKGVVQCCQVIGGEMARAGRGSIININSIYGLVSPDQRIYQYRRDRGENFFKPVTYSVSKSALLNLSRYLATYWASSNVRVNSLTFGGYYNGQDQEFLAGYCSRVPLGRMSREGEYTGSIIFLLSDASSYMTGANLVVDGGWTAW